MTEVLPDLLQDGLKVVICGTAAGATSARLRRYYAGPGNRFWRTLYRVGRTDRQLDPSEYAQLLGFGIGLTDHAKRASGPDAVVGDAAFDRERLRAAMERYQPRVLAFNGKKAAAAFLFRDVEYGEQAELIGQTAVFVAPSTSAAANAYWDESVWRALAALVLLDPTE